MWAVTHAWSDTGWDSRRALPFHLWPSHGLLYRWSHRLHLFCHILTFTKAEYCVLWAHRVRNFVWEWSLVCLTAQAFPQASSAMSSQSIFVAVKLSPLPEVWLPKPESEHQASHSLWVSVGLWDASHLGSAIRQDLCSGFSSFCFQSIFRCACHCNPLWDPNAPADLACEGVSFSLFLLHDSLSRVQVPIPKSFVSLFIFIFCPTNFWRLDCLFGSLGSPGACRRCSVGVIPQADEFWCICEGEDDLPVLSLCHLESPPCLKILFDFTFDSLWHTRCWKVGCLISTYLWIFKISSCYWFLVSYHGQKCIWYYFNF